MVVWAAFVAFIVAMLLVDLFVLHRDAHEVTLREAGVLERPSGWPWASPSA